MCYFIYCFLLSIDIKVFRHINLKNLVEKSYLNCFHIFMNSIAEHHITNSLFYIYRSLNYVIPIGEKQRHLLVKKNLLLNSILNVFLSRDLSSIPVKLRLQNSLPSLTYRKGREIQHPRFYLFL